jgi:hypothetical protein
LAAAGPAVSLRADVAAIITENAMSHRQAMRALRVMDKSWLMQDLPDK